MKLLIKLIFILTILIKFVYSNSISNNNTIVPLTLCMSCRAQGTETLNKSGSCEYGSNESGIHLVTLNEYFLNNGVKCGDCFEISGPNGKSVVKVVNFCSPNTCPLSSDKPLFMLTPDAFSEITNNQLSLVYDAGFRKVSCNSLNINNEPIKAILSQDSSKYYIKLLIFNNNVVIKDITIKSSQLSLTSPPSLPFKMIRQNNNSAQFIWNDPNNKDVIVFPATITITSQYGQSVKYELKSIDSIGNDQVLEFSDNLDVPFNNQIKNAPSTCSLAPSPLDVYNNGNLTEGWNYWSSRQYSKINLNDTSSISSPNASSSLSVILLGSSSTLTLKRSGDFETTYFSSIIVNIYSNTTLEKFKFYFSYDNKEVSSSTSTSSTSSTSSYYWSPDTPIQSNNWTSLTIPFPSILHKSIESCLTFENGDNVNAYIFINNIKFIPSSDSSIKSYYDSSSNETNVIGNLATTGTTTSDIVSNNVTSTTTGNGSNPTGIIHTTTTTTSTSTTTGKTIPLTGTSKTTSDPLTLTGSLNNNESSQESYEHSSSSKIQISLSISIIVFFMLL